MSKPVPLEELQDAFDQVELGYLLTTPVSGDGVGQVKVVSVDPRWVDGRLEVRPSRGTIDNLASNPAATIIFPPAEPAGMTLIVDGRAEAIEDGIALTPESAIWHRSSR